MPCALAVHLSIAYGVWGGASGALEGGVLFQGAVQDYQSVRTMEVFQPRTLGWNGCLVEPRLCTPGIFSSGGIENLPRILNQVGK